MPQFTPSTDGMTVKELVALGRFAWHGALGRSSLKDRTAVAEAIERCDLAAFAQRSVDELSGGERQRAWIAMMLAQESRWLPLDEPTSALDAGHQVEILDLIAALTAERGIGVVAVLHDINTAARVADWLARMVVFPYQLPLGLFAALIGGGYLVIRLAGGMRGGT